MQKQYYPEAYFNEKYHIGFACGDSRTWIRDVRIKMNYAINSMLYAQAVVAYISAMDDFFANVKN